MGSKVFWTVVFGFLFGVFLRSFVPLTYSFALSLALLGTSLALLSLFEQKNARRTILASIALIACACGILRMGAATLFGDPLLNQNLNTNVSLEGIVTAEPDVRDTSVRVYVQADHLVDGSSGEIVSAGVLAVLPAHSDIAYGDRVRLSGRLSLPEAFDTGEGREFAYPEYLAKDGIGYEIERAQFERIGEPQYRIIGTPNYFSAGAIALKELFVHGLDTALPEPEAGLAAGITVGDKRSVGTELTDVFQRDSLVHMVVLSGYNITVVLNAIGKLLAWAPRMFGSLGAIGTVLFFMLMTGGAASAVRSGLMALIAVYARTSGRLFVAERALGAVAFAMVLLNPWTLCFDPSFQLSALATLGLVLFTPIVARYLGWATERFGVREVLSATIATQLTVLPLLLYQSGTLSLVALPANLLALAPVPLAMLLSLVAGVFGIVLGHIASVIAIPAYIVLAYLIGVARLFAALPFAALTVPAFPASVMFVLYAILFCGYAYQTRTPRAGRGVRNVAEGTTSSEPEPCREQATSRRVLPG